MKLNFSRLQVMFLCLLWISVRAAQLVVGDALPVFSAKDQRGEIFNFTNSLKFLLVAKEMACAKAANLKLAEQGGGFLECHQAVYLMDIHTMPAVARFFALPKMRKYPQRIVLVESAEISATYPAVPGKLAVLALTPAGRIQKISFWDPVHEPVAKCFE